MSVGVMSVKLKGWIFRARSATMRNGCIHWSPMSSDMLTKTKAQRCPVRGLLASTEMLALDDAAVVAGMVLALQNLVERGLVGTTLIEGGHDEEAHSVTVPLGGELAMVTAIRRKPALIGVVTISGSNENEGTDSHVFGGRCRNPPWCSDRGRGTHWPA